MCSIPSITVNHKKKSTLGTKVLQGQGSYYDGNFWYFGIKINSKINKHVFILFIYFSKSIKKSTLNFKCNTGMLGLKLIVVLSRC